MGRLRPSVFRAVFPLLALLTGLMRMSTYVWGSVDQDHNMNVVNLATLTFAIIPTIMYFVTTTFILYFLLEMLNRSFGSRQRTIWLVCCRLNAMSACFVVNFIVVTLLCVPLVICGVTDDSNVAITALESVDVVLNIGAAVIFVLVRLRIRRRLVAFLNGGEGDRDPTSDSRAVWQLRKISILTASLILSFVGRSAIFMWELIAFGLIR